MYKNIKLVLLDCLIFIQNYENGLVLRKDGDRLNDGIIVVLPIGMFTTCRDSLKK